MSEVDSNGDKIRGNEEPRDTVLLDSQLYSEKDITNRRNKANVAFYTYKNLWLYNSVKISESLCLYRHKEALLAIVSFTHLRNLNIAVANSFNNVKFIVY